jgi:cytoskeletal protein CcmA (bactofilin family)
MWRKPTDVKPSSRVPEASPAAPLRSQEVYQTPAIPSSAPASRVFVAPAEAVSTPATRESSRISSGLKISGEISGKSDLYIDGQVQGKIRLTDASVVVGPNGRVQAEIDAREITIDGSVQGNLTAGERLHLGPSSRVVGTVLTPRIGIEDGALLKGKVETVRPQQSRGSSAPERTRDSEDLHTVTVTAKSE